MFIEANARINPPQPFLSSAYALCILNIICYDRAHLGN